MNIEKIIQAFENLRYFESTCEVEWSRVQAEADIAIKTLTMSKAEKELEMFKKALSIGGVSVSALTDILKSDSVYTLARYGFVYQEKTGIDKHQDGGFYELYKICVKLRKH